MSSTNFAEQGHENPQEIPFDCKIFLAEKVHLGGFLLSPTQVVHMKKLVSIDYEAQLESIKKATQDKLKALGYDDIVIEGHYLYARKGPIYPGEGIGHNKSGDLRITFERVVCEPTTVVAQQIQLDDGTFTFRQWNPKKAFVRVGENTDPDIESGCVACGCLPCTQVVANCFQTSFPEAVDFVKEDPIKKNELFDEKEADRKGNRA